jgi:hypothetical protein
MMTGSGNCPEVVNEKLPFDCVSALPSKLFGTRFCWASHPVMPEAGIVTPWVKIGSAPVMASAGNESATNTKMFGIGSPLNLHKDVSGPHGEYTVPENVVV